MPQPILFGQENNGVQIRDFGEEKCRSAHTYGPATRGYYLIHFVASGKGELSAGGRIWKVEAGQGFLIYPGEVTTYRADAQDPWHYAWVGYHGPQAEDITGQVGFAREKRVLTAPNPALVWEMLLQIKRDAAELRLGHLAALGGLYRFLALLAPEKEENAAPEHARHYEKALWYMQGAYHRPITVQEIADFVGLSRSQLFRVFEKACGQSPKAVLQELRLHQARILLKEKELSVEEVAYSVGMNSGAQLGAAFREKFGVSPRAYREKIRKQKEYYSCS